VAAGIVLLAAAAVGVGYPLWWQHRSESRGAALLRAAEAARTAAEAPGGVCTTPVGPGGTLASAAEPTLPAVLEVPAIGLEAPVLAGTSSAVLDVAVGHVDGTAWPGAPGEAVFVAHDVSYFSGLDRVRLGEQVEFQDACEQVSFRVTSIGVTRPGAPLVDPAGIPSIALVTCWPTDALFWTPQRFVVQGTWTGTTAASASPPPPPPPLDLRVPAPPALAAEGLGLAESGLLVGRLRLAGHPATAFAEGPEPLEAAAAALRDDAAAWRTAEAGDRAWWRSLALPGVALPRPWSLAYDTRVTLIVDGETVTGAVLSSPAETLVLVVHHDTLYVAAARA